MLEVLSSLSRHTVASIDELRPGLTPRGWRGAGTQGAARGGRRIHLHAGAAGAGSAGNHTLSLEVVRQLADASPLRAALACVLTLQRRAAAAAAGGGVTMEARETAALADAAAERCAPFPALAHWSRTRAHVPPRYGDGKVTNRETKVWHGATENGP